MSSATQSVICEEIFDDTSHPSAAEIRDYASKIGIDPDTEPQLLPLAAEGLMRPLPGGWKPYFDDSKKAYYYHNSNAGTSQWEHPLDDFYRELVVKARTESQSISVGEATEDATYTRDDIPSYEEPPPIPQLGQHRKDIKLSPIKMKFKSGELIQKYNTEITDLNSKNDSKLYKQKSEEKPSIANINRKMNLSLFSSSDENELQIDQHAKEVDNKGLSVLGGGSMFLKTHTQKTNLPISAQNKESEYQPRSILRENSKSTDTDKLLSEDDEKKNVRFNIKTNSKESLFSSDESEIDNKKNENVIDVKITKNKPKSRFTVFSVQEDDHTDAETQLLSDNLENDINTNSNQLKSAEQSYSNMTAYNTSKLLKDASFSTDSEDGSILNVIKENKEILVNTDKNSKNHILSNSSDLRNKQQTKLYSNLIAEETDKKAQYLKSNSAHVCETEVKSILETERVNYENNIQQELQLLKKEMENHLSELKSKEKLVFESQLNQQKVEFQEKYETLKSEFEKTLKDDFVVKKQEIEKTYNEKIILMKRELEEKLEKSKDELIVSHNAILNQIKENHNAVIDELQKDYKAEEDIIRRGHQKQISELRNKVSREIDTEKNKTKDAEEERLYEKVRCEKRLLEDKYRCLKDKYLKLKTEVKLSIEKRNRKKEQNLTLATTTGSETEKSPSGKKDSKDNDNKYSSTRTPIQSPLSNRKHSPKHKKSNNEYKHKLKLDNNIRQIIIQDQDTSTSDLSYKFDNGIRKYDSQHEYDSSDIDINPCRSRKKLFSRLKSSSTSRINNNNIKSKESQRSYSPVENLRKQLQKLEDLEDQFPQNAQTDTYHLRYPFSDGQKFEGSSELEFFRHRIHLERDSIKRAKESLRKQKNKFKQKQTDLKLKHGSSARNTLQQLYQEEKELTDMEVSLHRTRSLLGEKVIRLRHLEQSLHRVSVTNNQQKQEDVTLSDLSSHSASSGISSTEFVMADSSAIKNVQFKEPSEIIQSLENLNLEIQEIWDVLNKQQVTKVGAVLPSLPLMYPDLGWPLLTGAAPVPPSIPTLADRLQNYRHHIALANAQSTMVTHDTQGATTTLVEKTKNLRQWLRQSTSLDATIDGNIPEATL